MEHPHDALDPLPTTRRGDVARDLDAIFADRSGKPRAAGIVGTVTARRRRRRLVPTVIGVGALALAGASVGVAMFVGDVAPAKPLTSAPKTAAVHGHAPVPHPPVSRSDISLPPSEAAAGSVSAPPISPPSAVESVARRSPPIRGTEARIARPVSRTQSNDAARAPVLADGCSDLQDEERAWCMRPSLLAAHRQLRATYNAARRAGVDSDALARIQERWTNLQRRAAERPDETLDRYRDMRLQLLDLIDEQQSTGSDR